MFAESRARRLVLVPLILAWTATCRSGGNKPLAPADSYVLFVPNGMGSKPGAPLEVRRVDVDHPAVQPLPRSRCGSGISRSPLTRSRRAP